MDTLSKPTYLSTYLLVKIFLSRLLLLFLWPRLKTIILIVISNSNSLFSSDSYTTNDVTMEWGKEDPVELSREGLYMPQFELLSTEAVSCADQLSTGQYI